MVGLEAAQSGGKFIRGHNQIEEVFDRQWFAGGELAEVTELDEGRGLMEGQIYGDCVSESVCVGRL